MLQKKVHPLNGLMDRDTYNCKKKKLSNLKTRNLDLLLWSMILCSFALRQFDC